MNLQGLEGSRGEWCTPHTRWSHPSTPHKVPLDKLLGYFGQFCRLLPGKLNELWRGAKTYLFKHELLCHTFFCFNTNNFISHNDQTIIIIVSSLDGIALYLCWSSLNIIPHINFSVQYPVYISFMTVYTNTSDFLLNGLLQSKRMQCSAKKAT